MASRSLKPVSYLASAAQQTPSRSPRPSFTRTGSSSSTYSTTSDDYFAATSRSQNHGSEGTTANEPAGKSGGVFAPHVVALGSPVSQPQTFPDPSSRKRSKPIAIELPAKNNPTSYTPLTGRGDNHKGGYFPDQSSLSKTYKGYHFPRSGASTPGSPTNMSSASSVVSSPGDEITPTVSNTGLSSQLNAFTIPSGKYYPSNYKSPATTRAQTPTSAPDTIPPTSLSPADLSIPPEKYAKNKKQMGHQRGDSDAKRQVKQYQRDMVLQSRYAAMNSIGATSGLPETPNNPKLAPAGSPGPITPFALEEGDGYLAAGNRARGPSLIGNGVESERQLVEELIKVENSRISGAGRPRNLN